MKKTKYNIIIFPGSNCDKDIQHVVNLYNGEYELIWHKDRHLKNPDVVVIPGGFSYGDYLRCGALANFSNIMPSIIEYANAGGLVIGICNGFQILTEARLLPGTLIKNKSLKFVCQHQSIKVINNSTPFSCDYEENEIIDIPIAHKDGFYFIEEKGLNELIQNNQIVFTYEQSNPNGSLLNIAGIINSKGNVLGMMPHPERAAESVLQSERGAGVFKSIDKWVKQHS